MGIADSFGAAFMKSQLAADNGLPASGAIFVTVNDHDKANVLPIARRFYEMGFKVYATEGTARFLRSRGVPTERVFKIHEGRPHGLDLIVNGEVQLLINTPMGKHAQADDYRLRQAAIARRMPYTTTLSAANAACDAVLSLRSRAPVVRPLQEWHRMLERVGAASGGGGEEAPA
jgi:carbamoyl-phosphate synthase large subunit